MASATDFLFKIVVIGDSNSGKSSLVNRFCDGKYVESYIPTIGVDFKTKIMEISSKNVKFQIWDTAGQERFKSITSSYYRNSDAILVVCDITNKESFDNIPFWIDEYFRSSGGCSFATARSNGLIEDEIPIILIGNKSDTAFGGSFDVDVGNGEDMNNSTELKTMRNFKKSDRNTDSFDNPYFIKNEKVLFKDKIVREVETRDLIKLSDELKLPYFETSSKTGKNIERVFHYLGERLVSRGPKTVDYITPQPKTFLESITPFTSYISEGCC